MTHCYSDPNESAFPLTGDALDAGGPAQGITVREYFAARALQGILSNPSLIPSLSGHADEKSRRADVTTAELAACLACIFADALVTELKKE